MNFITVRVFSSIFFLIGISGMCAFFLGVYRIAKSSMKVEAVLKNIQEQLK